MLGGVFICYRREDSAGFARLIYDRLTHKLGHESVFFDVDNIAPGLDFVDILSERVGKCDALIAVIGKTWTSSAYLDNQRRLDDPNDFVRIEIEAALARKIRVIPVLIDGAAMPRPDDLPDSLKKLTRRQGIEISHSRFDSDVDRLTRALSSLEETLRQREAVEAERAAREERERHEAEEAAEKAAEARRLAEIEASRRADEERRAQEAAEAERAAREERERREAEETAAKAAEARRLIEASRRADDERRAREAAEAERAKRPRVERERKTEVEEPRLEAAAGVARPLFKPPSAAPERPLGPAITEFAARATRPSVIVASIVGAIVFLAAALLVAHFEFAPNVPATTTARITETSPPAPNASSAEAQYLKGYNFEYGFGTAVNYQQAAYWYGQAADQGYAHAQYTLGRLYEGGVGVIREYGQAKAWYQKAADQGYEPAKDALKRLLATDTPTASTTETTPTAPEDQYKVGDHYYYGVGGVKQDYQQAISWYRKAADQGYPAAQLKLGSIYEYGWGVDKDYDKARSWYQKAADQGNGDAKAALSQLERKTNPPRQTR